MAKLSTGDRIALSAQFLKNTGQQAGSAGQRRGTFLGHYAGLPKTYGLVRWDDQEERIATGAGQFGEADYCEHVRANGELVPLSNIAKVGSAAFACNDL